MGLFIGSSSEAELNGQMPLDHTWRMSGIQQRAGLSQLTQLEKSFGQKRRLSDYYDHMLAEASWPIAQRQPDTVLLRYPVNVANKAALLESARRERIELGSWFESPLHPTPLAQHINFGYSLGQCPHSEKAAQQVINLPLHNRISMEEAKRIAQFFLLHAVPPGLS